MTTKKKRVFITGFGSVASVDDALGFAELSAQEAADASAPTRTRPVMHFDASAFVSENAARRMDRFTLLAYVAVMKALQNARLQLSAEQRERNGLVMSTCYGPLDSTRRYLIKLIRDGAKKVPAAVFPNTVHNAFTGLITMDLKALGTSSTVSGSNPICYGLDMIRDGRDDVMIVGGCDELVDTITSGFRHAGHLPADHDATATREDAGNGFALGEGAAVLVLESEESARARGATILAEVLDYGVTNGLGGPEVVFPSDREGVEVAMQQAMTRSGVASTSIRYISAASNGLPHVAQAEREAFANLFGDVAPPQIGSIKQVLGETLGAASTFSALLAVDAMTKPFASFDDDDAGVTLVNSIELGGNITCLALRRSATLSN